MPKAVGYTTEPNSAQPSRNFNTGQRRGLFSSSMESAATFGLLTRAKRVSFPPYLQALTFSLHFDTIERSRLRCFQPIGGVAVRKQSCESKLRRPRNFVRRLKAQVLSDTHTHIHIYIYDFAFRER